MELAVVFEIESLLPEIIFPLEKAGSDHWQEQARSPKGEQRGGQWVKDPASSPPDPPREPEQAKSGNLFGEFSTGLPVGKPIPPPQQDTRGFYRNPATGKWHEDRYAYQQSLIEHAIQSSENRVLQPLYDQFDHSQPAAVFLVGGPGSGKGVYKAAKLLPYHRFVDIDCDTFKEQLPEYEDENPTFVHHESVDIAKRCLKRCLSEGRSFCYDSTGIDVATIEKAARRASDSGYHVAVHYVTAHPDAAVERAAKRKRKVPEHIVRLKHREVGWAFSRLNGLADSVVIHDSMSPEEREKYGEYKP